MNETKPMSEYLLLFRGKDWDEGLPQEELQRLLDSTTAWLDELTKSGRVKAGQPLARTGTVVSGAKGKGVMDGPFVESKEGIAGYLILLVENEAEAVAIAKSMPTLFYGISAEVRPLLDQCPCFERARQKLNLVTA